MQYAILQSNSPRLVGRAPVCACFSATCVYFECKKVLLSPSLVPSWPLTCASMSPYLCSFMLNFGADYAD